MIYKEAHVAGEHPSYIASNAGPSLPDFISVAGKGMDTETCLDKKGKSLKVPIKDSM